jgi:hypothetical protein
MSQFRATEGDSMTSINKTSVPDDSTSIEIPKSKSVKTGDSGTEDFFSGEEGEFEEF